MAGDWRGIPGNEHVFEQLIAVLVGGGAIGFVGAGASAGLYPLWPQLIQRLADEAVAQGMASQTDWTFWCASSTKPQQAVQGIKTALGAGAYAQALRDIFGQRTGPDGNSYTSVHAALMRLPFRGFVTTNYDLGLVDARSAVRPGASSRYATWRDDDPVSRWLSEDIFREPCPILFAHGVCERTDTIVLGADEYREAYATAPFSTLFNFLWGQRRLVFVGFGFSDPWLDFLADAAVSRTAARHVAGPRHFAIIGLKQDEAYTPERRRTFRDAYNADPLFYPIALAAGGEDHSALLHVLQALFDKMPPVVNGSGGFRGSPAPGSPSNGGGKGPGPSSAGSALGLSAHEQGAVRLLAKTPRLLGALQTRFGSFAPAEGAPDRAEDMVRVIARCPAERAKAAIELVRGALYDAVEGDPLDANERRAAEEATAFLYCLAVVPILVSEGEDGILSRAKANHFVQEVACGANAVCAIIAMVMSDGELVLVPGKKNERLPEGEYVFEVSAPGPTDQDEADLLQEICVAINEKDLRSTALSLDRGSDQAAPPHDLRAAIGARFHTYKIRRKARGLVVSGLKEHEIKAAAELLCRFANDHEVPIMLPNTKANQQLLGMSVSDLVAEIEEFWGELEILPRKVDQATPRSASNSSSRGTWAG